MPEQVAVVFLLIGKVERLRGTDRSLFVLYVVGCYPRFQLRSFFGKQGSRAHDFAFALRENGYA